MLYFLGKATILHRLKWGESARVLPTIGFNVETVVSREGRPLTLWVINGKDKTRVLWKHYADNTQGRLTAGTYKNSTTDFTFGQ